MTAAFGSSAASTRSARLRRRIAIVAFNAVPLAGVLWLDWSVAVLMLLYWAENVVVGVFTLLRILTAGAAGGAGGLPALLILAPFFVLHYGAFLAAHLLLLTEMFLGPIAYAAMDSGAVFLQGPRTLWEQDALWSVVALAGPHAWTFVGWLRRRGHRRDGQSTLMGRTYGAVILLQLTILLAGAVAVALGQPLGALVLMVLLKIGIDLAAEHWADRRRRLGLPVN